MVLLVSMSSRRFLVDVGVGAAYGPTEPIPLEANKVVPSMAPRCLRLIRRTISDEVVSVSPDAQLLWQFEHRNKDADEWMPTYVFSELEFFPADYEIMNWYTSTHRSSWFTHKIVCGLMLMDLGNESEEIIGYKSLFEKSIKKRYLGQDEAPYEITTEAARIEKLQSWFGVKLDEVEISSIEGTCTEII